VKWQEPSGCVIRVPTEKSDPFEPTAVMMPVLHAQPSFFTPIFVKANEMFHEFLICAISLSV
jgi:hypothetical protein